MFLCEDFRLYDQEIYSVHQRKPPLLTAALQKVASTKEFRKIDTWLDSLSSSQLSGNFNSQERWPDTLCSSWPALTRAALKRRRRKKQQSVKKQWNNVSQELCFWSPLVWFVLFSMKIMGMKTTGRKLYERIIGSKTKLKSHATNPCFVQGGWHNNNGFSIFWLCSFSQGRSVVSRQDTEDKCYRTVMICPSQLVKQWNRC